MMHLNMQCYASQSPLTSLCVNMNTSVSLLLLAIFSVIGSSNAQAQVNPGRRAARPRPQSRTSTTTTRPISASDLQCPEPNGFYADAEQCDKYYECRDNVATPKLCPDGLVFLEAAGPNVEKCEFPFAVDCSGRAQLQPAKPSLNCPRKNGYFPHEDVKICDKFFYCVDGSYNAITCPAGLVFNERTGICTWPDEAKKKHCGSGDLFSFTCPQLPKNPDGTGQVHPRFADPEDCQSYFICIDGINPRKGGCGSGTVFNEKNGQCDKVKNVPECKDWYKGVLDYDDDGELRTTSTTRRSVVSSNSVSRRKKPRPSGSSNSNSGGGTSTSNSGGGGSRFRPVVREQVEQVEQEQE